MESRIAAVRRAVILAAGKATRLGGENKLLVEAGGVPVARWHERLLRGIPTTIVTRSDQAASVMEVATWAKVIAHDELDGPVGALKAYRSITRHPEEETIVLFADTLLVPQPLPAGSWVGVAPAPARVWDLPSPWGWTRGKPYLTVCVGIYAFDNARRLDDAIGFLTVGPDVPFAKLLHAYALSSRLNQNNVRGWHDAGDRDAIALVPDFEEALLEDPPARSDVVGWLDVALTR
jgi:hypothetical protein